MRHFPPDTDGFLVLSMDQVLNNKVDPDETGDWAGTTFRWRIFRELGLKLSPLMPTEVEWEADIRPGFLTTYLMDTVHIDFTDAFGGTEGRVLIRMDEQSLTVIIVSYDMTTQFDKTYDLRNVGNIDIEEIFDALTTFHSYLQEG